MRTSIRVQRVASDGETQIDARHRLVAERAGGRDDRRAGAR